MGEAKEADAMHRARVYDKQKRQLEDALDAAQDGMDLPSWIENRIQEAIDANNEDVDSAQSLVDDLDRDLFAVECELFKVRKALQAFDEEP